MATGVDLRGPEITPYPGTGPITDALWLAQSIATGRSYSATSDRLPGGGAGILADFHSFRFRTRAEAVNNYDGETLNQLKGDDLFTHAEVLVEFWRDNPQDLNSDIIYNQRLTAEYDPSPTPQYLGWRTSGGAAADAGRVGLKLVKVANANANVVKQYRADQAVSAGEVRYYDDGQGVLFFKALQDMAAPVPVPVRGQATAYWEPADFPDDAGGGAAFDPYDVSTEKALAVIAAYKAAGGGIVEADEEYFGKEFTDDFTELPDQFQYRCTPRRPKQDGQPTLWYWSRYHEAGPSN